MSLLPTAPSTRLTFVPSILDLIASYLEDVDAGSFARTHSRLREAGEREIWREVVLQPKTLDAAIDDLHLMNDLLRRHPIRRGYILRFVVRFKHPISITGPINPAWSSHPERFLAILDTTAGAIQQLHACRSLRLEAVHDLTVPSWLKITPNIAAFSFNGFSVPGKRLAASMLPALPSLTALEVSSVADLPPTAAYAALFEAYIAGVGSLTIGSACSGTGASYRFVRDLIAKHATSMSALVKLSLPRHLYPRSISMPKLRHVAMFPRGGGQPLDLKGNPAGLFPSGPEIETITYDFNFQRLGGAECDHTFSIAAQLITYLAKNPRLVQMRSRKGTTIDIRQFASATNTLYHLEVNHNDAIRHLAWFDGICPSLSALREAYDHAHLVFDYLPIGRDGTLRESAWQILDAHKEACIQGDIEDECEACHDPAHEPDSDSEPENSTYNVSVVI